jgi:SPP1 gp7 family putative phage head morphogenesis protein
MSYADMLDLSRQFRLALLQQERGAAAQMISYYSQTYQAMQDRIAVLLRQIAQAQANGTPVRTSWLWEEHRLQALMSQIAIEIQRFSVFAYGLVLTEEQKALLAGAFQSEELLKASLPGISVVFNHLPAWQLQHLVGNLQNGSPLKALFDSLATNGARRAGQVLFDGVAAGHGPRVIAKQLESALGTPLNRALTISRTETLRVYNQAAMSNFRANSDVVAEWEWGASDDARICPICRDLNGKRFPLSVDFVQAHPNDRCQPRPVTYSYEEILRRFAA